MISFDPPPEPHSSTPFPLTRGGVWKRVGALALGVLVLGCVSQALLPQPGHLRVLALLRLALEVIALVPVAKRWGERRQERWWWGFLGLALISYALEDVLLLAQRGNGDAPTGLLGSLVLGGSILAAPLAFLHWPARAVQGGHRWRAALDGLLFAYAAFFFTWLVGMRVWVAEVPGFDLLGDLRVVSLLRSILLLGLCVWRGAREPRRWTGPLAWIAAYFLLSTTINALVMGITLGAHYALPGRPTSLVKLAALACFAGAAWWPIPLNGEAEGRISGRWQAFVDTLPYLPPLLTILATGVYLLTSPGKVDAALIAWGLPLMLLLLGRQYLSLHELRKFSRELETKVAQRTQALEQTQRLALTTERMNTVASLGAGLAHDLNNLIGVSKNYAELMEMELDEGRPPDRQDLRRIKEASGRAGELTAQLMAFGRQQDARPRRVCLREHLLERLSLFRMVARAPAQLVVDPGEDPLPLHLDPSQIDQLIVNLLSNARDAMPRGGRVWIRLRRTELEPDRPAAVLEVQDEGSGIPPDVMARIFDPFFTTKEAGKGTGLGLASVRALVEGWSGQLSVQSEAGQGALFRIVLPLAMEEGRASDPGLDPTPT